MKSFRLLALPLLAVALSASLPAETPPALKAVEPVRVAYINSALFLDETNGIKELVRATSALDLEFSTAQSELSLLNEKLRTIAGDVVRLRADPTANAKALESKQAEGLKLQQELQSKQQAAQTAYAQRQKETQGPVTAEISKTLHAFSKEHDIGLLFDVSKLEGAVVDAKPELDLTTEFIAYYNAKHQ